MAYIKVDYSKFETTAKAIDNYVSNTKRKMAGANDAVNFLAGSWQGADFNKFKVQWNKVSAGDSTYIQMMKALESYAKYLRFAAQKYKSAQTEAINRANSLPRW